MQWASPRCPEGRDPPGAPLECCRKRHPLRPLNPKHVEPLLPAPPQRGRRRRLVVGWVTHEQKFSAGPQDDVLAVALQGLAGSRPEVMGIIEVDLGTEGHQEGTYGSRLPFICSGQNAL